MVVRRLRAAGHGVAWKNQHRAICLRRGWELNNDHGTPHNPWSEKHHVPGGSSSGSAVAVAAGLVPMALRQLTPADRCEFQRLFAELTGSQNHGRSNQSRRCIPTQLVVGFRGPSHAFA